MKQPATKKARPAKQGKELQRPFDFGHADSRCPQRLYLCPSGEQRPLRHKFKTTQRKLVRTGVFATRMTCVACEGFVRGLEDYTVLASVFSL